jgi:hypothetical protein
MKSLLIILMIGLTAFAGERPRDPRFIDAFPILPNTLEISRLAQPTQYFDKIGPHAGLMGYESGQFEMWVWPWKPLRNFELQFLLGTSTQPIFAKDIVRTISVTPELTTITYTYEAFTVREHIFIPRHEPGAVILLDVHTTTDLAIIPGFIPVMQPMWPAGIGGQFSYWDDDVKGYVISEGQWRAEFICGSPAGAPMAAPPAHMFADNPLQFRIDVKPGETDGKFIPIVIAGAMPDTTTWKMKMDSVKATYARLCTDPGRYYRESFEHYQDLQHWTMHIETPDDDINRAFAWGKVALDNLMIVNPRLGYGMVAGFGLSGGGGRPGFAWYFGGDAFINVLTLNSVGMFRQARAALAFTQKWQRQENYPIRKKNPNDPPKDVGKMAHELTQSDGMCDWWNDYRYGYNHADTSPWYLVAMGDYVRTSGDTAFLRESWRSVKQAYAWCLSKDSDGDGLMDLKGAGLGALEFGKLVGIYADVYTCGVWVQGIKEMRYMSELMRDEPQAGQADSLYPVAKQRLEKLFWLEKEGFYSYGATAEGVQVREKTPWSGVAMMFGLLDEKRTAKSIEAFNSADLCTDWGVRTLSNKSALFEPTNYNYGAVWPFVSSFFNTAQYKHGYSLSGDQILIATAAHAFDHAIGVVPEVFSGAINEKLGEAYHHQGFSTTGYLLPLVKGLLGIEVDGLQKKLSISPHFPSRWTRISSPGTRARLFVGTMVAENTLQVTVDMAEQPFPNQSIMIENHGADSIEFTYNHPVSARFAVDSFSVLATSQSGAAWVVHHPQRVRHATGEDRIPINLTFAPSGERWLMHQVVVPSREFSEFNFDLIKCSPGATNAGLRIISTSITDGKLNLTVEGLSGTTAELQERVFRSISSVTGAELRSNGFHITFERRSPPEFVRKHIVVSFKQ